MSRKVIGRSLFAIGLLIVLGLVIPPFANVNRYRARIADSMSRALGRQVTVGEISLRIVPQPGFDLQNVVIADDAAFSSEPILRADEVTAYLRLSSLWRGRLEIAKLGLKYPSLNLVRAADGHWNVESLLWRAARTQTAPTTKRSPEARIRFPYIEAEAGRINFKSGLEKSVFSLNDADFALWSPTENEWRMRLDAKPVRTDVQMTDTGSVKAEATFRRAEMLRDTPLQGKLVWQKGQLGHITKLIWGQDRGWRGGVEFSAEFSGTPADLHFTSSASVTDFRRFDIIRSEPIRIDAGCKGVANMSTDVLSGFSCQVPTGRGEIAIAGSIGSAFKAYDISLTAENVPANSLVALARHAKRDLPDDLTAAGSVNTTIKFQRTGDGEQERVWNGTGSITDLALTSSVLSEPLKIERAEFTVNAPGQSVSPSPVEARIGKKRHSVPQIPKIAAEQFLTLSSSKVALGGETPVTMGGYLTTSGYGISVAGPASIERAVSAARALGLSVPRVNLTGRATMNAQLTGIWKGLPEPSLQGVGAVKNVRAEVPGIASPIEIASADVNFSGNQFRLTNLSGSAGALKFTGFALLPRHCEDDRACGPELALTFDELDTAAINELFNPNLKKRPWYRLFGSRHEESILSQLYAVGRVNAKRYVLGKVAVTHFYTDFRLQKGEMLLTNVRGEVFGGSHVGDWRADYTGKSPLYSGSGTVQRANVAQLSSTVREPLGTGSLTARYKASLSGFTAEELAKALDVETDFQWERGALKSVALTGKAPLQFSNFTGQANWRAGSLHFEKARLIANTGKYDVTGTAGSDYQLDLRFSTESGAGYAVRGPLQKPTVGTLESSTRAEASLRR